MHTQTYCFKIQLQPKVLQLIYFFMFLSDLETLRNKQKLFDFSTLCPNDPKTIIFFVFARIFEAFVLHYANIKKVALNIDFKMFSVRANKT